MKMRLLFYITLMIGSYVISEDIEMLVTDCLKYSEVAQYMISRKSGYEMSVVLLDETLYSQCCTWEMYHYEKTGGEAVQTKSPYGRGPLFVLEPYMLKRGIYRIVAKLKSRSSIQKECFLGIRAEMSKAIIQGGLKRLVEAERAIKLDGGQSLDMSVPRNARKTLKYEWTCTSSGAPGKQFCADKKGNGKTFEIPKKYAANGLIYWVKLTVTNQDDEKSSGTVSVELKTQVHEIVIRCINNCPPTAMASNKEAFSTVFEIECLSNCGQICPYIWEVRAEGTDDILNTPECNGKTQCPIYEDVFKGKENAFTVSVHCDGPGVTAHVSTTLIFTEAPKFSCSLNPKIGKALEDSFKIYCEQESGSKIDSYDIYTLEGDQLDVFVEAFPPGITKSFRLPANTKKLAVVGSSVLGIKDIKVMKVQVHNSFNAGETAATLTPRIKKFYFDNLKKHLVVTKNVDEAISCFSSLLDSMSTITKGVNEAEYQNFIYNLKLFMMEDLSLIPVTNYNRLLQVSEIVRKVIGYQTPSKSVPYLAKAASMLCLKLAYDQVDLIKTVPMPEEVGMKTNSIATALAECGDKNSHSNEDVLQPMPSLSSDTTRLPDVTIEETIEENYENYIDYDEKYYENMEIYSESSFNILKTVSLSSKAIAESMNHPPASFVVNTEDVVQKIVKSYGKDHQDEMIENFIEVIPSEDIKLKMSKDVITLSVVTWKKNIFWWYRSKIKPLTALAKIDFENSKSHNRIDSFNAPNIIILDIIHQNPHQFTVLKGSLSTRKMARSEDQILYNIRRVDLFMGQTLIVEFHDLGPDDVYKVVVTNYEVPTRKLFKDKAILFDHESNVAAFRNDNDYDSWFYVAVLPNDESAQLYQSNYAVSLYAASCYVFKFQKGWKRTCKSGDYTTKEIISCECKHLSTIAGTMEPVQSKTIEYDDIEFELESHVCYAIFISVIALFILFCIRLMKRNTKRGIYYLPDNDPEDHYFYLLTIRTRRFAKTSARITINIIGDMGESRPRTLNYPDPRHLIFQMDGIDIFILSTPKNLGEVESIELWHDSHGIKPSWYCHDVEITDLQNHKGWYFKLRKTLTVARGGFLEAFPTERKSVMWSVCQDLETHGWNVFASDLIENDQYYSKLLEIYSKVITVMTTVSLIYGLPSFQMKDCLDAYSHYTIDGFLFGSAVGSSLLTFILFKLFLLYHRLRRRFTIICLFLIVSSNTILLVCGFWIPFHSSMRIITAWLLGLLLDIVFYENLFRVLYRKINGPKASDESKIWDLVKEQMRRQRKYLQDMVDESQWRINTESMHVRLDYRTLKLKQLHLQRIKLFGHEFKDLFMFSIYVIILYAIVLIDKNSLNIYSKKTVMDVMEGKFTRTQSFSGIKTISDIYSYIKDTLIEGMQTDLWYDNYILPDPGSLIDFNNKYIGVARIRQGRMGRHNCEIADDMKELNPTSQCIPDYQYRKEEKKMFADGWSNPIDILSVYKRLYSMWVYMTSSRSGSWMYDGVFSKYSGGGYIVPLGRTRYNSFKNFIVARNSSWIDRYTKIVYIEYLIYNSNFNIFVSIQAAIEISSTGWIEKSIKVTPARLLLVGEHVTYILLVMSYLLWSTLIIYTKAKWLYQERLRTFKDVWSIIDIIIALLSIGAIIVYSIRASFIRDLLNQLEVSKHNTFVNYFTLFYIEKFMDYLGSFLVCCATMRLWKVLRLFLIFRIFEKTVILLAFIMLPLLLYLTILMTSFTFIFTIILGEFSSTFDTYQHTLTYIILFFLSIIDDIDYELFQKGLHFIGIIALIMYVVIVQTALYLNQAFVMIVYGEAQMFYSEEPPKYDLKAFIMDNIYFMMNKERKHLKHIKTRSKVVPRINEYVNLNCVSTTKYNMKSMSLVSMIVLRNILQTETGRNVLEKEEVYMMLKVCYHFLVDRPQGDSKEVFFKRDLTPKIALIDSLRQDRAKQIVEIMLGGGEWEEDDEEGHTITFASQLQILDSYQRRLSACLRLLTNIKVV